MPDVDMPNVFLGGAAKPADAFGIPPTPSVAGKPAAGRASDTESVQKMPEVEDVTEALVDVQKFADKVSGRALQFTIDEVLERSVITVLEAGTDKVVRQIPSEEFVAVAKFLRSQTVDTEFNEAVKGLLFNDES